MENNVSTSEVTEREVTEREVARSEPIQALRGTKDMLPADAAKWHRVRQAVDDVAAVFGYGEIRTPIIESARLFNRSVGEETDIVSKEMYVFTDKGGEEIALRPELTAPAIRAVVEHGMLTGQSDSVRLYYNSAANLRYEKPQLGRLRQHHQFGTEFLGSASASSDAETIAYAIAVFRKLGLKQFRVRLNSLASPEARIEWKRVLVPYLKDHFGELSTESKRRTETNPMRVLDSKAEQDREVIKNAPVILDFLTEADRAHFESLQRHLRSTGIEFSVDPLLVRGLDYYTRTVFEVTSPDLGSQDALCGGGRYDNLVEQLGGPATPAVGFGAGIERLLIALEKIWPETPSVAQPTVYVVGLGAAARERAFATTSALRAADISASQDHNERSMKAQMREANRDAAKFVYIIGESELAEGAGMLKTMSTGEQEKVPFDSLVEKLQNVNHHS
ncbi:MAG: histidine--tRNA ligase [Bacteroidota bacterium]|nr:histidine--tRNA ligase [Bacteroidota bacterium]MDP4234546.1 histidine--tRNA ligase [Bacteroidota bacterium]MDP4242611.1 histidine--tRNA ligase [Bacteroidota bacterium]MDP4289187.1 histidine--tRNA ligase [Bacteroidota bacterium]